MKCRRPSLRTWLPRNRLSNSRAEASCKLFLVCLLSSSDSSEAQTPWEEKALTYLQTYVAIPSWKTLYENKTEAAYQVRNTLLMTSLDTFTFPACR
ncbi:hypothetical protein BaRGS_00007539 [Batillaria attramentaria]|uniref:Uncharacterized protein n=1 Tax=Batillaria attramentaria TaxID=370345 RepID=A0ABD0LPX4_9CAEN